MSITKTSQWSSDFTSGQTSAEEFKRSGRLSCSRTGEDVAKVWQVIYDDRRRIISDVFNIRGLSYGTCRRT
jgi:hypothetical protein